METDEMLISIIIPCYNSAKFVNSTIEMLLKQDLNNCELILVDDGSKDNTLEVLQQYEDWDNVCVIHQENAGVSVARNTGLAAARGRYVYFLDSDDALMPGTLDFYRQVLREHPSCKMFCFGYEMLKDGLLKKRYAYPSFDNHEYGGQLLMQNLLMKKFCVNICSSIFDRSFLLNNNLNFSSGTRIGEDSLFMYQVMLQVGIRIYYSSRICFLYQLRDDSVTQAYRIFNEDSYNSIRLKFNLFSNYSKTHKEMRPYISYFMCFIYLSNLYRYLCSDTSNTYLNRCFYEDRHLRYCPLSLVTHRWWFLMFFSRFIPVKLLLTICK